MIEGLNANLAAPLVALATSLGSLQSFSPHPSSVASPLIDALALLRNKT